MPDANGRIRPVSVPDVPWCLTCKLVDCTCHPAVCEERCEDMNRLCSCGRCSCVGCVCAGDVPAVPDANVGMQRAGYRPFNAMDRYMDSKD